MRLGVLGGFLTGTVLSGLVLGVASVVTQPPSSVPQAGDVDVPAGSEFNQSRDDEQAELPASDATPGATEVTQVPQPELDDLASLEGADTEPATAPQPGAAESTLAAPEAPDTGSGVELDSDDPVLPSPQALAPEVPESEEDLSISTEPAQPVQPEIVETESGVFESAPEAPTTPELPEDVESQAAEGAPVPSDTDQPEIAQPEGEAAEAAAPEVVETPAAEPAPEEESATEEAVAAAVSPETSGTIGNLAEGVTTGRLPSVSEDGSATSGQAPPLVRYAAAFDNPEAKPLMSILLIDDGQSPINHEALADFPYPISYAVDASWPGAAEAARKYRAAGLEVLAMADLPAGASATDTEVAMQSFLSAVPEAIAVMEGTQSGLQTSREATEQLIPILQESGHGLVLFSEGLDTAQKLIAREGVNVATVFRDFDSKDQSATVIRRFLDQAAFRAGQAENGVIMVGRLRGETVSALLLWGLQDRANSVALAPVSAILQNAN